MQIHALPIPTFICSYCLKSMGGKTEPGMSHGICQFHLAIEREKLAVIRAERERFNQQIKEQSK